MNNYTFNVHVRESLKNLRFPADNVNSAVTTAQVIIAKEIYGSQHPVVSTDC